VPQSHHFRGAIQSSWSHQLHKTTAAHRPAFWGPRSRAPKYFCTHPSISSPIMLLHKCQSYTFLCVPKCVSLSHNNKTASGCGFAPERTMGVYNVTSAESLSTFRQQLKTHSCSKPFPAITFLDKYVSQWMSLKIESEALGKWDTRGCQRTLIVNKMF